MGNIHQVEVIVHIDDTLNDGQRSDLVNHLRDCDGIEQARFTPGREHLMLIDYDRERLHAQDVLGYVRESYTGAELIGPI
ncbi:MAG: heavy-metal-associated domain-containing protein [Gammaproteobacteria bacterium]|nr:heavy-metal-associated domain-containing protein [Gammaproteobacteria bacterium]